MKNYILNYATTWITFEDIILSDISQLKKDKYCMIHLYEESTVLKFTETEGRVVVEELFNGLELQLCKIKKGLEMDVGDACTANVNILNTTEWCVHLKWLKWQILYVFYHNLKIKIQASRKPPICRKSQRVG
jgi:hypothetical protein